MLTKIWKRLDWRDNKHAKHSFRIYIFNILNVVLKASCKENIHTDCLNTFYTPSWLDTTRIWPKPIWSSECKSWTYKRHHVAKKKMNASYDFAHPKAIRKRIPSWRPVHVRAGRKTSRRHAGFRTRWRLWASCFPHASQDASRLMMRPLRSGEHPSTSHPTHTFVFPSLLAELHGNGCLCKAAKKKKKKRAECYKKKTQKSKWKHNNGVSLWTACHVLTTRPH